jgi:hypothetical protein
VIFLGLQRNSYSRHREFGVDTPLAAVGYFCPFKGCSMKSRGFLFFALALGLLIVSAPAFAHHGASAYDTKKLTTLKGTVTDFQFMNPHSEIFLDVKNADGKVEKWSAEAASMVTMSRLGWTKTLFKPGDQITIVGNRARNGSPTMRLSKVVLANGKEYGVQRGEDYADQ